jgi:phenol hydroxylase P4 protein
MTVRALQPNYGGPVRDREENFHGMRIVFVGWDRHLMYSNPLALLVAPAMTFDQLLQETLPAAYGLHPDWPQIDWSRVTWLLGGKAFSPDRSASLQANGIGHKSLLRLQTPGLNGIRGSCS